MTARRRRAPDCARPPPQPSGFDDGETLAMGSTTGGLWVGTSGGERWECLSRDLPPIAVLRFA